jgi:WD40 repeat protein
MGLTFPHKRPAIEHGLWVLHGLKPSAQISSNLNLVYRCCSILTIFVGGAQGVVAVSWCLQDPSLLLSAGKDGRIILWDVSPQQNAPAGQPLGEFSSGGAFGEYAHDVAWSPTNPGVFAAASLGGGENHSGAVSCVLAAEKYL